MFSPYGATKHYGAAIQKELERRGAIVSNYDERPSQKTTTKIIVRLFKKRIPQIFDKYISRVISDNKEVRFDYILICRGEAFSKLTINHLREAFPGVKVILYLWDIIKYCDKRDIIPYCDSVFSFDPEDAQNNQMKFRPTFFVDDYLGVKNNKIRNDIVFIGTVYPPRQKSIRKLTTFFKKQGYRFYRYMYVPSFIIYIRNLVKGFPFFRLNEVQFKPLSIKETVNLLSESKALLDVNPPIQKSLSTRPYEAMAARRKYITTNKEIIKYDFYNPNNIIIIDIEAPIISNEFFKTQFEEIPNEILYKYSVQGLVDDLFQ